MSDEYDVGYGKPPKHTQFKKGQSGNPRGRPKGSKNLKTDLEDELKEFVVIKEGGVGKKVTKQKAALKSLTAKAINGDTKALSFFLNMILQLMPPPATDELDEGQKTHIKVPDKATLVRIKRHLDQLVPDEDGEGSNDE